MPKLTVGDIKQGTFIWYAGSTSLFGWNCPAVITKVDQQAQVFFVMSLDDMCEQTQAYAMNETAHSPDSRKNMRTATSEEISAFLGKQEVNLAEEISENRRALDESEKTLARFRAERDKLFPT